MALDLGVVTTRDIATSRHIVYTACVKFCNFIMVPAYIVCQLPCKVLCNNRLYIKCQFKTVVSQRSDVAELLVTEVGHGRNIYRCQQIFRVAAIGIKTHTEASVQYRQVKTNVVGSSLLPSQIWIVVIGARCVVICATERIHGIRITTNVKRHIIEVCNTILLTSVTPVQTKLQFIDPINVLEERFVVNLPCKSCRREVAPLLTLSKA